jgi:diphthamide synthase (EF-2-diphthine--ammonia ligase)
MELRTVPPKAFVSWSSGKDSAFALHEAQRLGLAEIVGVLTTINEVYDRVAMHGVRTALLDRQIEALGLPAIKVPIPSPCPNAVYEARMAEACGRIRAQGVRHIVFGDLFLEDIRAWRIEKLSAAGMEPVFPLWKRDTAGLAREMIASGLSARIVCLDPNRLDRKFTRWRRSLRRERRISYRGHRGPDVPSRTPRARRRNRRARWFRLYRCDSRIVGWSRLHLPNRGRVIASFMRILAVIGIVLAYVAIVLLQGRAMPLPAPPKGVPIAAIANGKTEPRIGLVSPLPEWIPLPESGTVTGAGVYRPQPPWGAASVVMLKMDRPAAAFVAAYGKRLAASGFPLRRIPNPPNLVIDAPWATYEAVDRKSGNTVFVTIRSFWEPHFAQLTFWNPPVPNR